MKRLFPIIGAILFSFACIGQQSISRIEYFVDDDPGFGAGVPVTISPGTPQDVTFNIPTSSLEVGFHQVTVRAQDANNTWGILLSKPFYVSEQTIIQQNDLVKAEYFLDDDPGFGSGIEIPIASLASIDITESIPTDTLTEGFHLLSVRAQDDEGAWSLLTTRSVFVTPGDQLLQNTIDSVEYFLDEDPGIGNATPISFTSGTSIDHTEILDLSSLEAGFHLMGWRVKDDDDNWSTTEVRPFYISPEDRSNINIVEAVEYYIDSDPGVGLANAVTITPGATIDIIENILTDTLTAGFHTLSFRARSDDSSWSVLDTRNFYVAQSSVIDTAPVILLEYYIDEDPGFGSGALVDVEDGTSIDTLIAVLSDTLSEGFHTISFRAMDADSVWSSQTTRSIFVGQSFGQQKIASLEYFIDDDPGIGNGFPLDLEDSTYIDTLITFMTDTLEQGLYTLGIRAIQEDTVFGMTEYATFTVSDDSCFTDSILLSLLYTRTSVNDWIDSTGWLVDPVANWQGVVLNGCVVQELRLDSNNLTGPFPDFFGDFHQLSYLDVSGNQFTDSIPSNLLNLSSLTYLNVAGNNLTDLSALNTLPNLDTLDVRNNQLDFFDFEQAFGIPVLLADPQLPLTEDSTYVLFVEDEISLSVPISGSSSFVTWFKDGEEITGIDTNVLTFSNIALLDSGVYSATVGNSATPDILLRSGSFTFLVSDPDACQRDSLALLALYNATDGDNWSTNTNWGTGPIHTWHGVSTVGCRVDSLNLSDNGLTGTIPEDLNDLTELVCLDVSDNQLDSLPEVITDLQKLIATNNILNFNSIIANQGLPQFEFNPQSVLSLDTTINLEEGDTLTLNAPLTDASLTYEWSVNGVVLPNQSDPILEIRDVLVTDTGRYAVAVSHPNLTGFAYASGNFFVQIEKSDQTVDIEITNSDPVSYYPFGDLDSLAQLCPDKDISFLEPGTLGSLTVKGDSIEFVPIEGSLGADTIIFVASESCTNSSVNDTLIVEIVNIKPEFFRGNINDSISVFEIEEDDELKLELDRADNIFDFNANLDWTTLEMIQESKAHTSLNLDLASRSLFVSYQDTNYIGFDTIVLRICDLLGACDTGYVVLDFNFDIQTYNALSPNGDDVAEFFLIKNIHRYPTAKVTIFDAWGNQVWEELGYDNDEVKFIGQDKNGNELPDGVYYYVISEDNRNLCDPERAVVGSEDFNCQGYLVLKR